MTQQPFDDDAVASFVGYFAERLNLAFSYFYCVIEFEGDEDFTADPFDNGRAWSLQTIREACLHTTLIALRDLEDVLTPRTDRSRPDDFKISDFGFPHTLGFLAESERIAINKHIAHSTLPGSQPGPFRWDVFELVTKGVSQALKFLDWVAEQKGAEQFESWSSAIYCRARTKKIYDYFAAAIKERREAKASNH
jgi:hypothetical protein